MNKNFDEIKKRARSLPVEQKATLARLLIDDLDQTMDPDAEQLWIEEARRRYDAFRAGELDAVPGEEAMKKARQRLKQLSSRFSW